MKRRDFIALIGGIAANWPLAIRAQEAGRTYRLGTLSLSPRKSPAPVAFYEGLKRYGFIEGQNLIADPNGYGLRMEQFADHAAEIVKSRVDVIVCTGDPAIRAAQQATHTIPILGSTEDMLESGFVHSLAKPEGNITGHSILSTELNGKRQEILMEILPGVRHMAALAEAGTYSLQRLQPLQDLSRARGIELSVYWVSKPEEITDAVDAAKKSGAGALNVLASPFSYAYRQIIRNAAAARSLPGIYQFPEMAEEGGLIAYGSSIVAIWRDLASRQLAALLRGAKVADVPVERPTRFDLVINLKAANALGLAISESFLLRADEVIE